MVCATNPNDLMKSTRMFSSHVTDM